MKYYTYLITYDDFIYEPYLVTNIIEVDGCINMNQDIYTTLHDFVEDEDGDLISTSENTFTAVKELDLYKTKQVCQIYLAFENPLPQRIYHLVNNKELRVSIC